MRNLLLCFSSLTLIVGSFSGLTSCGHTLYGMSLDTERLRARVPQTGQARYRNDGYQQPYSQTPPYSQPSPAPGIYSPGTY